MSIFSVKRAVIQKNVVVCRVVHEEAGKALKLDHQSAFETIFLETSIATLKKHICKGKILWHYL